MNNEGVSDFDMGFNSPVWMLKALVANADPAMLRYGVSEMLNYLCYTKDPEMNKAFDVLAQITSVGYYTPTYKHSCGGDDDHVNPRMDPTIRHLYKEPESSLREAEQERLIKEFNAMLGIVPTTDNEEENNE
jgi:hypothetical protein